MARQSAGILLFRRVSGRFEVLLVHPGGPYWTNKDEGAWSIPKGEVGEDEDPLEAAVREFGEELGVPVDGSFVALTPVRQRGGKRVLAWAVEGDLDCSQIRSNTFEMEWPSKSDRMRSFPEVDRAAWFDLETASRKINPAQAPLLLELLQEVPHPRR